MIVSENNTHSMKLKLQPNEGIIRKGHANHYTLRMVMTGKLYLTNQRLVFVTHPLNFRQYVLSLPLNDIEAVELKNNFRFFSHGLWIRVRNTTEPHHFAVWHRKQWKKQIETAQHAMR